MSSLAGFLEIFGFGKGPDSPLEANGSFTHSGTNWQLANLSGHFAGSPMTGNIGLAEGSQRQPDILRPDLELSFYDFKQLKDNGNTSGDAAAGTSKAPGLLVHGRLNAKQLEWGKIRLSDLEIRATVSDDQNQDVSATFGFLGGSASATGVIAFLGNGNISADAELTDADLATGIVSLVAPNARGITGKLDLKVKLHGTAFEDPINTTTGHIELSISKGTIARELLDKGSTDLRSLFHDGKHMVPISCFHAEGHLKEGILHIDELRLDASAVQLHLHGLVDLARGQIDTVLHSRSGSLLALDHPLSIRGPLSRPSVAPAKGNDPSSLPDQQRFNRPDGCG